MFEVGQVSSRHQCMSEALASQQLLPASEELLSSRSF